MNIPEEINNPTPLTTPKSVLFKEDIATTKEYIIDSSHESVECIGCGKNFKVLIDLLPRPCPVSCATCRKKSYKTAQHKKRQETMERKKIK